jgi:VanZ family protein
MEWSVPQGNDLALKAFKRINQMSEMLYRWRWCIWSGFALAWTAALLAPIPSGGSWDTLTDLTMRWKFIAAKCLHVSAYAFWSVLSAWLRVPARYRFLLVFCMMAHATLTEVLQFMLTDFIGRNGNLMDVALDQVGIMLGVVVAWRWWTA